MAAYYIHIKKENGVGEVLVIESYTIAGYSRML
jgi:hypothetical protein